jgi:hypothetical protein
MSRSLFGHSTARTIFNPGHDFNSPQPKFLESKLGYQNGCFRRHAFARSIGSNPIAKISKTRISIDVIETTYAQELAAQRIEYAKLIALSLLPFNRKISKGL